MPSSVSVCMATYNGGRFVEHQLATILSELEPDDEVVIVDDASTDDTTSLIRALGDPRIRLIVHERNHGYVRTFEDSMREARGDVLLLSDQDDEWIAGRRNLLVAAAGRTGVAASNIVLRGTNAPLRHPITGRPWRLRSATSSQRRRNRIRILGGLSPYFGCAMAIRRDVLPLILPFPDYLFESHDLWIATVANAAGLLEHVDTPTLRRRVHDANASTERPRNARAVLRARRLLIRLNREADRRIRSASLTS